MQALKLLGQQLTKIWHQLGLNQKIIVIVSGVAVVIGLAGLVYWSARPDYALLYGNLDPAEVGRIQAELDQKKIMYVLGTSGSSIRVPRERVDSIRAELAVKGIPKQQGVGYELFDKPAFGMSDFMLQQNSTRALQGELERTLSQFEGVEWARVFIVKPERTLLIDPAKKSTASITLKMRSLSQMDPRTVSAMRSFVSGAVTGLKPNDISIVDTAGNLLAEPQEDGSFSSLSQTQLASQRNAERYLAGKVYDMLTPVYGPKDQDVVVTVSVQLDNETMTKTDDIYDPQGTPRTKQEIYEKNSSSTPKPGGVPGTDPNANTSTNTPAFTLAETESVTTNNQTEYLVSRKSTNISRMPGALKHIKASVIINTTSNTNVDEAAVKRLVVNAIGIEVGSATVAPGEGTVPDITEVMVSKVAFNVKQKTEFDDRVKTEERTALLWKIGRNSLYVIIALAALILFWRLVRSSSEELLPTGIPVGQLVGGQLVYEAPSGAPAVGFPSGMVQSMGDQRVEEVVSADQDVEDLQAAKSKLVMDFGLGQAAPERITIEVLKQLIRENPGKMGQAARVWLARKNDE